MEMVTRAIARLFHLLPWVILAICLWLVAHEVREAVAVYARESAVEKCFEVMKNMDCAKEAKR